jgi:hypothetical protein
MMNFGHTDGQDAFQSVQRSRLVHFVLMIDELKRVFQINTTELPIAPLFTTDETDNDQQRYDSDYPT